jgi:hypothetical protein
MNTTTKESIDTIFDRLIADCHKHPCKVCGKPESSHEEDGHCDECWDASPEKAARIAEKQRKIAETARGMATARLAGIVPLEIRGTDTAHPQFNLSGWQRIQGAHDHDSTDWFWIHSRTSGRCKSRVAYLLLLDQFTMAIGKRIDENGSHRGNLPTVAWVDGDRLTEAFRVRHQYSLGEGVMTAAHELVEHATTATLLVIDDLTKRKLSGEAASDGLWEIIKHREAWHLRTIITDNYLPEDLEGMLHVKHAEYITRRLQERCIQVDFDPSRP